MSSQTSTPWYNQLPEDEDEREQALRVSYYDDQDDFFSILTGGFEMGDGRTVSYTGDNLYLGMGFASNGIGNWKDVEKDLADWCNRNDARHDRNWVFMTHGDAEHFMKDANGEKQPIKSIESVAQYIKERDIPIVCMQSHFGYAEPGDAHWPTYASAVLFGIGKFNTVRGVAKCCYGGYVTNDPGKGLMVEATGELSFPDEAMALQRIGPNRVRLVDGLRGIFIAGGGPITRAQAEIYKFGSRDGDGYSHAVTVAGDTSIMSSIYSAQHIRASKTQRFTTN